MLTPINNVYAPMFQAPCLKCARMMPGHDLLAAEEPFTFVCWYCWTSEERAAARVAYDAQFRALDDAGRYRVRRALFGKARADELAGSAPGSRWILRR